MNSHRPLAGLRMLLLAPASVLLASPLLWAQRSANPDATTLAKYDLNKNGQLDASELSAMEADQKAATAPATTGDASRASGKDVIELSPFQVNAAEDKGYYASSTLSGTRINSKLEDLGASISVVTKQQMQDFALLDINDIFLYEASTEGTGNYSDVVVDRNGVVIDNVAGDPNNANRVRGIGAANQARGNFQTSGRVPFDPVNIDAVEISRGPNSNIFGLGNGSGTVNTIPSQANVTREYTTLELRLDSNGSTRGLIDFNRPIIRNKLALRASAVRQVDEYVRQPSFSRTNRYNAMVTFKPFKNTVLRGAFEHYENYARRPNSVLPRDAVSYWKENGRPTWDPSTWTVTRNGVKTVVPFNSNAGTENAALGPGLETGSTGLYARPSIFVGEFGDVNLWMVGRQNGFITGTTTPSPDTQAGNPRWVQSGPAPRVGPLAPTVASITDKSIYDWTETNIAAANWSEDSVNTFTAELEHFFIQTPRHVLAAQLGWNRENAKRYNRSFIGTGGDSPMILYVDVNEKLLDGRPNPYFLRPYVNGLEPTVSRQPLKRDIYRGQLAYMLNFAKDENWRRWIGDHVISAYGEYKDTWSSNYRFRDVIVDNHAWLAAGVNRSEGATVARGYYRYYLGDNQGQNIEYGSPAVRQISGTYNLNWYNASLSQWVQEPATIGEAFRPAGDAPRLNLIKTVGAVIQNHWFGGRLVTTVGLRKDENFNRRASNTQLLPDGISPDYGSDDVILDDWFQRSGKTETMGAVVKPLRGLKFLDRRAENGSGLTRLGAEFLRSLNFHYNKADSFRPESIAQSLRLELLPNPTSEGEDFGFSFSLFGKFYLRANFYETKQINSRTGDAGTIATRAVRLDFRSDQYNLRRQAEAWIIATEPGLAPDVLAQKVADTMGLPVDMLARIDAYTIAETSDVVSKGKEITIDYNPSKFLRTKMTIAEQKVVEQNVTPAIQDYIDARWPIWTTVIDKRTNQLWWTTRYGSQGTAVDFYNGSVAAPYKLLRATEGKSRPQIRQWRVNALANLSLAAISDNKWLSRTEVSGAVRWEDKASIGYYTFANDPTAYDPDRVIYDEARTYVDLGASYRGKLFRNKVSYTVRLNVRNAFESGRLQPIGALPNGQPHSFRIIDPRLFILSATFDL